MRRRPKVALQQYFPAFTTRHSADVARTRDLALALTGHGWRIHEIGVAPTLDAPGWFNGVTPAGVTTTVFELNRPHDPAERFAASIGRIARDPQPFSALADLQAELRARGVLVLPQAAKARFDPIPGLGLIEQPRPVVVAAYWHALPLVLHKWQLSHLGEDIAQGGYIAETPGGDTRIIPAATPDDGTPATALARLIADMNPGERAHLCHLLQTAVNVRVVHRNSRAHMVRLKVVDTLRRRR